MKTIKTFYCNLKENIKYKKIANFLTDTSSFKKTLFLSLLYVFLFYFPFTFMVVVLNKAVFFQLDHLYQFSTIVFDFRNRIFDLNFSTWDFKNGIGYDYFANFYYIPLDITLLPFFLLPFLSYSQLMWLSFLLKILLGTACFTYLLKLYKLDHKTILFMAFLYGSADLFFAQNVFASYTGLIIYIPLILIAIELIFQKNNYLIFSLVIFQIFLFNYYWAWNLSLFMALALLGRCIYQFFTKKNILTEKPYKEMTWVLSKSLFFYLIGLGLAGFFFMPTFFGIMKNEPRMELSQEGFLDIFKNIFKTFDLKYNSMVYYKQFFKMLVPNLYMYSGYYYDKEVSYWLMTNHIIIYSSILASFSLFFIILYPNSLAMEKLNDKQLKIFMTLKISTIIATILMLFPFTSYLFSLNSGSYLRWLIFYGFLLIIDLAFIIEYKLFNKRLFLVFLVISCGFLFYSIRFNQNYIAEYRLKYGKSPSSFSATDQGVTYTMLILYIVLIFLITAFEKHFRLRFILLIERIVGIGLIFSICVTPHFIRGVKHVDIYGKEVNNMMKNINIDGYYTMTEFLFYNDENSEDTMQDMTYLFDFPVYNNFNLFHSLVNPHFTFYRTGHTRYLRTKDIPFYYYYYTDPSIIIISNSQTNPIKNGMYDPDSKIIATKKINELNSYINIYYKEPIFSIGNGFTTYYDMASNLYYDYLWIDSIYVKDEAIIEYLKNNDFKKTTTSTYQVRKIITESTYFPSDIPGYEDGFTQYYFDISKEDHDVIIFNDTSKNAFSIDKEGNIQRCYNKFCFVPQNGLKSIVIDKDVDFYTIKKDYLIEKTNEIIKYSAYDVEINKNNIKSKVDNDKPIIMTYKVGYAKGWDVYVDNKKVKTFPSYNGQLSFIIKETGTHNIEMVYETPYLKQGIKLSMISCVIFSFFVFLHYYNRRKKCARI